MNPSPNDGGKLEELVHRTLREIPVRRAPRSLELRVLAEIERRLALPWWRKSFAHWPNLARAAFIILCAALVRLALTGGGWLIGGFAPPEIKTAFAQQFSWMESGLAVVHAIAGVCEIMSRNIPSLWLYVGLVFFATLYAALFGLGAAAYKALHVRA
jgi:hypothetical protein